MAAAPRKKSRKRSGRSKSTPQVSRAIQAALHDFVLLEALSVAKSNMVNDILMQYENGAYGLGLQGTDLVDFVDLLNGGKRKISVPELVNHYKCLRGDYGKGPDPLPGQGQRGKPQEWS